MRFGRLPIRQRPCAAACRPSGCRCGRSSRSAVHDGHDVPTRQNVPLLRRISRKTWEDGVRAQQRGDHSARPACLRASPCDAAGVSRPRTTCPASSRATQATSAGASRAFAAALSAAPDYIDARLAAVRLATEQRDTDTAVAMCEDGLAQAPRNVESCAHSALRISRAVTESPRRWCSSARSRCDPKTAIRFTTSASRCRSGARCPRRCARIDRRLRSTRTSIAAQFNLGVAIPGEWRPRCGDRRVRSSASHGSAACRGLREPRGRAIRVRPIRGLA